MYLQSISKEYLTPVLHYKNDQSLLYENIFILLNIYINVNYVHNFEEKVPEKWENTYSTVKTTTAPTAYIMTLDPVRYILTFSHNDIMLHRQKLEYFSGPTLTKSWIH